MTQDKVAHCPGCGKPVMSEGEFSSFAKFKIKCPWCQEAIQIQVVAKVIAISLKPVISAMEVNSIETADKVKS